MSRRDLDLSGHRPDRAVLGRVLGYARRYRLLLVWFGLLTLVSSVITVAPAWIFREIIDHGVLTGDLRLVVRLALLVAGLALADAGVQVAQRWCSARIGEGLVFDLRAEVFGHVQRMPIAFFTRSDTGKLVSRLHSDVRGAQQAFTSTLSTALSSTLTLILVAGSMLVLSWQLTLASLLLLPLLMIPASRVGNRLARLTRENMSLNAELSSTLTERFSVSGALLVALFGQPDREYARFADVAAGVRDGSVRITMIGRIFMTALTLVAALATALVYGVGGWAAIRGSLTVGTLTALVALLARLYGPLLQLANLRVDVMSALVSFERIFEVLDLPVSLHDAPDARPVPEPAEVEFRDVSFRYPSGKEVSLSSLEPGSVQHPSTEAPVLHGISFRIPVGGTLALVGPSGAGKTTITHLIARLYDVDQGQVLIGGVDVRELQLRSLREQVGYVTQDAHMFHDTIRANLVYARPQATEQELWEALRAAQIADLVAELPEGLDTMVGERGYRLSGGERQRLAIARLLVKSPQIVVLDEATAHLDSESEQAVHQALDLVMAERTTLVIAHRLATVRHADEILVIEDGRVVERGTHQELLAAQGSYAALYALQFDSEPDREP